MIGKEEAAGVLGTPAAAHHIEPVRSVGVGHDPGKFARLQVRAARAGQALFRVTGGYMLIRGCASQHASDLDSIAALLARGGAR